MDGWMDGEKRNWRGRTFFPPFNGRNCVQLFPCLVAGTVSSIVRPTLDSWNSFPFIEIYRVYNSPLLLISFFPGIEPRFSRIFLSSLLHWKSTNFADEISFGFAIWDNVRRSVSRRITHIYTREVIHFPFATFRSYFAFYLLVDSRNRVIFFFNSAMPSRGGQQYEDE